jgi:glucoamylase
LHELFFGKPSGSAMPLVWAHAEYVKLRRSLRDSRVFDLPPQTAERYLVNRVVSLRTFWHFNHKCRAINVRETLRIETLAPAMVHWSGDGWSTTRDEHTQASGLGTHFVDLPTATLPPGARIAFTFYWPQVERWEGTDFEVDVL